MLGIFIIAYHFTLIQKSRVDVSITIGDVTKFDIDWLARAL